MNRIPIGYPQHTAMTRPLRSQTRQSTRRSSRRAERGVALMEALISILIFSFGVLGLIGLEARAINFSVDAEDRNRAALLANEIATDMWLSGNVTLSSAALAAWQTKVSDTSQRGVPNGTLATPPVAGSTNSVDITITWNPPSRATTDLSTLTTRVVLP